MKETGLYIRDLKSDFDKKWRLYRSYTDERLMKEHRGALLSQGWEVKEKTVWQI